MTAAKISPAEIPSDALRHLQSRLPSMRAAWVASRPFRWLVVDDFLPLDYVTTLERAFPDPSAPIWDGRAYVHQKKKLTCNTNMPGELGAFFQFTAHSEFRSLISEITGIQQLLADPALVGGGLHQIMPGGFLDVHVDYNLHPTTKLHRRLNLLVYLNRHWEPSYEGFLELWDMDARMRVAEIAPLFNRAVMFETNEVSYHGHPKPLATPAGVTRRSLAVYYYTEQRDDGVRADEHNTIYRQTTGVGGYLKTTQASVEAAVNLVRANGVRALAKKVVKRAVRTLRGQPPENG